MKKAEANVFIIILGILILCMAFILPSSFSEDEVYDIINGSDISFSTIVVGDSENYTKIDNNGTITYHGLARKEREIKLDVSRFTKGVSAPTEAVRIIGASGGVKKPVLQFSQAVQNDIFFEAHMNSDADDSENVSFHIMWIPGVSYSSGNYTWCLEYLVYYEDQVYGDSNTTKGGPNIICKTVTPNNNYDLIETKSDEIIDFNTNQVLIGHFYRNIAVDNANTVGSINFLEIEYKIKNTGE